MKANELRIGNWIIEKETQEVGQVNTVILGIIDEGLTHTYEPIPLTEEWLLKFGFEKASKDYVRYDLKATEDVYILYADDYSCGLFNSKESEENELGVIPNWETIKHVHQLQNLYFALTGQELQIKEQ